MQHFAMKGSIGDTLLIVITISLQVLSQGTAAVAQPEPPSALAPQPAPPPVSAAVPVPPPSLPAIFVFGDGALDVGNNDDLPEGQEMGDAPRANHPYYGIDSPNSEPTGRFSNGYNIADFIAKALRFQMSPAAYHSLPMPSPSTMEGFTGVNYASANAGIRESTNAQMTISLPEQVKNFAATRAHLKAVLGSRKLLNTFLSKSLFLIGVGSMDLLPWGNFYLTFPLKDNKTEVERLINIYNNTLTELHSLGARKFGIINVGLIGHLPAVQMSRYSSESSGLNRRAAEFNAALETCLSNLSTKLYRFRYSLTDFYGFSNSTFANPMATGFRDTKNACCTGLCAPYTYDDVCSNRMDYWFWDDLYTTEKAAKLAATAFYSGKAFTAPVNIKRLIAMKG